MKIGIICAMEEEIKFLIKNIDIYKKISIGKQLIYLGKYKSMDIVLSLSGIGKVQAAVTTTILINKYKVDFIVNTGSAAGIGDDLNIGNVIISSGVAYYDVDVTGFNYLLGQLPGQPRIFKASDYLVSNIKKSIDKTNIVCRIGLIVSGDSFINNNEDVKKILTIYPKALACEMEGASIGQVCYQFNKPFVVIRSISDTGDDKANINFDKFVIKAGENAAKILINFLNFVFYDI